MTTYSIGDPGRAATEVQPGIPSAPIGWPDTVADSVDVLDLVIRGASVRGVMHKFFKTPRQDSYSIAWLPDWEAVIITVCDGVGAYTRSNEAADIIARRLPEVLVFDAKTASPHWESAFAVLSAEIEEFACGDTMASTVVAACIQRADEGYAASLAWLGDSAAYLLHAGDWELLVGDVKTAQESDEPVSNGTFALPSRKIIAAVRRIEFGPGDAIFLMTDGVADPLGSGAGEVGTTLASWWATPPDQFTLAAQAGFARRSFDDDRTVVGVWALSVPAEEVSE